MLNIRVANVEVHDKKQNKDKSGIYPLDPAIIKAIISKGTLVILFDEN